MDDAQCPGHSMISRMRLAIPSIFSISRHAEIIQLLNIRLFSNPDIRVRREYRVSNTAFPTMYIRAMHDMFRMYEFNS